jgi:hypothetical protein
MITTGSKWFFGLAAAAVVAAVVYGWGSRGGFEGAMLFGFKGAVGELAGYAMLTFLAVAAASLGFAAAAFRDADAEAVAQVAGSDQVPEVEAPRSASYWPVVGAFGVVLALLGLAISEAFFLVGIVVIAIVLVEWVVQAWADRATGDPEVNQAIRNRMMFPIEIPLAAVIGILVFVLSVSRVLLALPKAGSNAIGIGAATLIFLGGLLLAYRPRLGRNVVAGLLVVGALAVVTGGIVSGAVGERDFEKHTEEHDEPAGEEHGMAVVNR